MTTLELALKVDEIFDTARRQILELLAEHERAPQQQDREVRLTARDVAQILKVSRSKVYEMRRDGRLPADVDMPGCKDRYRWLPSTIYRFNGDAPTEGKKGGKE